MTSIVTRGRNSLAAIAAAIAVDASAANVDLTNSFFHSTSNTQPASRRIESVERPRSGSTNDLSAAEAKAAMFCSFKPIVAQERKLVLQRIGPYRDKVVMALDRLSGALDTSDEAAITECLRNYEDERLRFGLARLGTFGMTVGGLSGLAMFFGVLDPKRMRREVEKVLSRPTGLNYNERNFLEESMGEPGTRRETISRLFDVLSYMAVRGDLKEAMRVGSMYQSMLVGSTISAALVVCGAATLSGSLAASTIATAGASICVLLALKRFALFSSERGKEMILRYNEWREKEE